MSKSSCFLLLLVAILMIWTFFPFISGEEITSQQQSGSELKITYLNINVELVDIDLVARRANFNLTGTLGLNFNASNDNLYVSVATRGSDLGQIIFVKYDSGLNSSNFQTYQNESGFIGFFQGGPETYPFDRYRFNFTLSFFLPDVLLTAQNVTFSYFVDWPLRAQFDQLSDNFTSVTQSDRGPVVSVGYALNRPEWRGYATLLPIYFIFALLGFSTFIKIEPDKLSYRIAVYMAVFTSALTYSISLQNILPPGRYYISIPEMLVYSIIGGATTFLIATLLAYRFRINRVLTDITAAIVTQAFLSFLLLTLYFVPYVEIDFNYLPVRLLAMQWIILALFFGTVYVSAISDFRALGHEIIGWEQLNKKLDDIVKRMYVLSFVLSLCTSGIFSYIRLVLPGVQFSLILSILLDFAGNNIWLMILLQVIVTITVLSSVYFLTTILRASFGNHINWLRDFFGFFFLLSYLVNFLYAFVLLPSDLLYITLPSIAGASICTFFFQTIRPAPPKEAYEQFIRWFDV